MADIVDTATQSGSFHTLTTAIAAAGLVQELKASGPFTVLAPSDEAFAKLPRERLDYLLAPENKEVLSQLLLHHVIRGKLLRKNIQPGLVQTILGNNVDFAGGSQGLVVGDANVVQTDIEADNGVIHVIDKVLTYPT